MPHKPKKHYNRRPTQSQILETQRQQTITNQYDQNNPETDWNKLVDDEEYPNNSNESSSEPDENNSNESECSHNHDCSCSEEESEEETNDKNLETEQIDQEPQFTNPSNTLPPTVSCATLTNTTTTTTTSITYATTTVSSITPPPSETKQQTNIPAIIIYTQETHKIIEFLAKLNPTPKFKTNIETNHITCKPLTASTHKKATELLQHHNISYYTHNPSEEKPIKYVLKYIPADISNQLIYDDIYRQGTNCLNVSRLMTTKNNTKIPSNVIILTIHPARENHIKTLTEVCNLQINCYPYIRQDIPQCHRCQKFWHSSQMCQMPAKCVKCGNSHLNTKCTADKCKCANCGGDHPANYKKCSSYTLAKARASPPPSPQHRRPTSQRRNTQTTTNPRPSEQEPANNPQQQQITDNAETPLQEQLTPKNSRNTTTKPKLLPEQTQFTAILELPAPTNTTTHQQQQQITPPTTVKNTPHKQQNTEQHSTPIKQDNNNPTIQLPTSQQENNTHINYIITAIQILEHLQAIDLHKTIQQIDLLKQILHTPLHPTDNNLTIHEIIQQTIT